MPRAPSPSSLGAAPLLAAGTTPADARRSGDRTLPEALGSCPVQDALPFSRLFTFSCFQSHEKGAVVSPGCFPAARLHGVLGALLLPMVKKEGCGALPSQRCSISNPPPPPCPPCELPGGLGVPTARAVDVHPAADPNPAAAAQGAGAAASTCPPFPGRRLQRALPSPLCDVGKRQADPGLTPKAVSQPRDVPPSARLCCLTHG